MNHILILLAYALFVCILITNIGTATKLKSSATKTHPDNQQLSNLLVGDKW